MSMPENSIYVLIHLPKCGGRSVFKMFQEILGEDKVLDLYANPFDQIENEDQIEQFYDETLDLSPYKAICGGHIDFQTDRKYFQGREPLFVSVVREPLERFVSYYNYTCMADEDFKDMTGRFPSSNPDLVKMAKSCKDLEEFYHNLLAEGDPAWNTADVQSMFLTGTKACAPDSVINCLDTGYHAVVPLPMVDLLAQKIASENGVELERAPIENISVKKSGAEDLSDEFIELFRRRTALDYFTYYYVYSKSMDHILQESRSENELLAADKGALTADNELLCADVDRLRARRWLFNGWPSRD